MWVGDSLLENFNGYYFRALMVFLTKSLGKHCDSSFLFLETLDNIEVTPNNPWRWEYKLLVVEIELRNRGFPFVILES